MSENDNVSLQGLATPAQSTSVKDSLQGLSMPELRRTASAKYGFRAPPTMTKRDIIAKIAALTELNSYADVVEDTSTRPKPGFTRIMILKDNIPGASNVPIPVFVNGRKVLIQRGMEVDVPDKFVHALRNAEEVKYGTTENGEEVKNIGPSYPFQVLDRTPGPDPWPGFEVNRAKRHKQREILRDKLGRWPNTKEFNLAMEQGRVEVS